MGQLRSLITSRHVFRSSWSFQKLMQVRYTSGLRKFLVLKIFFPRSDGSWNCKKKLCATFFSIFDVKYFLKKRTVNKPSEIQWNITGTIPRKLERKLLGLYPTRYNPLKSQKREKLLFTEVLWGPANQCGIQWFFYDFINFWNFQPLSFG